MAWVSSRQAHVPRSKCSRIVVAAPRAETGSSRKRHSHLVGFNNRIRASPFTPLLRLVQRGTGYCPYILFFIYNLVLYSMAAKGCCRR